jgi:hypothetical protein
MAATLRRIGMVVTTAALVVTAAVGVEAPAGAVTLQPAAATLDQAAPAVATTRTWGDPRTISPHRGGPEDLSCPTTSWCLAVDRNGGAFRWSHGTWYTEKRLPPDPFGFVPGFRSVSCPTTTFCLAAGYDVLAQWHGPGSTWQVSRTDDDYLDVDCYGPATCGLLRSSAASGTEFVRWTDGSLGRPVGLYDRRDPRELSCPTSTCHFLVTASGRTYVQRVVGSTLSSAYLSADPFSQLSCASSTSCLAVTADGSRHLSGGRWTPVRQIRGNAWIFQSATDVDCIAGTSACVVTGYGTQDAMSLRWNGSSWSWRAMSGDVNLHRALSCPASMSCRVVDSTGTFARWSGASWSPRTTFDRLRGGVGSVDCVATDDCVAADEFGNALEWNGSSWRRRSVAENRTSIDCAGSLCMSVSDWATTRARTHGVWGATRRPINQPIGNVECSSGTSCFSVMNDLVTRFTGSSWSSPHRLPVDLGDARGVTGDCPTSTFCMLAGASGRTTSWNGTRWVPRGSVPGYAAGGVAVDCTGSSFCMSMSDRGAAVFDGSSWQRLSTAALPSFGNGIGCLSATECYTVSGTTGGDLWRWTGSTWRLERPGITLPGSGVAYIACVRGPRCVVAAGAGVAMTS